VWEVVHRDKELSTKYLQVYRETIRSPAGHVIDDYYVATKGDGTLVMAFTDGDSVVMLREYEHGCHEYVWRLPGGGLSEGETASQAARRELLEETGYSVDRLEPLGTWFDRPGLMPDKTIVFVGYGAKRCADSAPEQSEDIKTHTVSKDELLLMAARNDLRSPISCAVILSVLVLEYAEFG
jgi:8-oxo-dGTP pyrophosphatase MutT (NUDIX family)